MGKIEENRARKMTDILAAARRIFLSDGYEAASMDGIANDAQVTKQTVYRYFPSKADLFQATLMELGKGTHEGFLIHLEKTDVQEALLGFAIGFIRFHLSDEYLAIYRLLVAESAKDPEISRRFFRVGPNHTRNALKAFFEERLQIKDPEALIRVWTGSLLEARSGVLIGMEPPSEEQVAEHARVATDVLLAAI